VQHLDFLNDDEKDVFKTAFELDQRWLIEHAGDRAEFICQAQSLNIFVPADVHKRDLHQIHFLAWKKGVKSLYYCRSKSMQRAESAIPMTPQMTPAATVPHLGKIASKGLAAGAASTTDYEECLACQ
jgi:ribonucleoside-diphosphate reductase alpha chain